MTTTMFSPGTSLPGHPPGDPAGDPKTSDLPDSKQVTDPSRHSAPRPTWWIAGATGLALAAGILLRFWTRSDLWLDEAQTLNIARLPLSHIPAALRRDGAPPLYYVLLHYWVRAFGISNLAVRALPGLIGVTTLPLAWRAGRLLGGTKVAWAATLLLASSPFAVWYSTDNRMYSLVVFEVFAGGLLLASVRRRPRAWNLVLLGVDAAALLYTHYWALFLLPVVGVGLLLAAWRSPSPQSPQRRRASLLSALALTVGALAFLPWLPSFLFQLHHTGTPWTTPVGLSMYPDTLQQFTGGVTDEGLGLEIVSSLLVLAGLFGTAVDGRRIEVDLRGNHRSLWLAGVLFGTLGLAIAGSKIAGSGFQDRYAAVVFPAFIMLCAFGTLSLASNRVRYGALACAVALGLFGASYNVTTDRTQATQVAALIRAHARPGDVVGYCPDQLGPDTSRLLPAALGLRQITFPRSTGPQLVDWVDYRKAIRAASPAAFADELIADAGNDRTIWFVWSGDYRDFGEDCRDIADDLWAARPDARRLVSPDPQKYAESAHLTEFRAVP